MSTMAIYYNIVNSLSTTMRLIKYNKFPSGIGSTVCRLFFHQILWGFPSVWETESSPMKHNFLHLERYVIPCQRGENYI